MTTPISEFLSEDSMKNKGCVFIIKPPEVNLYLVGGAVREIVRGFPEKVNDWDFAVEAPSFEYMRGWIRKQGFEIFLETPQYYTIRARSSKDFTFAGMDMSGRTFDFTLCRTESDYTDGRRPDKVSPGTIEQDLARRDFTVNSMALSSEGVLLDPFGGQNDISTGTIRCTGGISRFFEDGLRIIRALRFSIQLDYPLSDEIVDALSLDSTITHLDNISNNRIRDEVIKCMRISTVRTLHTFSRFPKVMERVFRENTIWLEPTMKK